MDPLNHEFLIGFDEALRFVHRYTNDESITQTTLIHWLDPRRFEKRLEYVSLGGKPHTSREALTRFLASNQDYRRPTSHGVYRRAC